MQNGEAAYKARDGLLSHIQMACSGCTQQNAIDSKKLKKKKPGFSSRQQRIIQRVSRTIHATLELLQRIVWGIRLPRRGRAANRSASVTFSSDLLEASRHLWVWGTGSRDLGRPTPAVQCTVQLLNAVANKVSGCRAFVPDSAQRWTSFPDSCISGVGKQTTYRFGPP